MKANVATLIKKFLVRTLLRLLVGSRNVDVSLALVEDARRTQGNEFARKGHVYRELKKGAGSALSIDELNLSVELARSLDSLVDKK